MSAKLEETVRTTYTPAELVKAFVQAWYTMYNQVPKKESIGVIYAQNALETGLTKSMWNNNIGNVKYVANVNDTETIQYCMLANTWEMVNGKKIIFQPPHPATWFRSFKTLTDGVVFHFNFLKNNRYKDSWGAIEKGDPALFAHLLKVKGYYTAAESDYVKLMNYYFNQFMKSKDFEAAAEGLVQPTPVTVIEDEPKPVVDPIVPAPLTELPKDHKPIDTIPTDTTSHETKALEITGWKKFGVTLLSVLTAIPWAKLIEWLSSQKK